MNTQTDGEKGIMVKYFMLEGNRNPYNHGNNYQFNKKTMVELRHSYVILG